MKLVQIGASKEGGAYYFSPQQEEFYHISNEQLPEINHVRPVSILLWLIFSLAVGMGIMSIPKNLFMDGDFALLMRCIFAIVIVSSIGLCHIISVNQKRKISWILENCCPIKADERLFDEIKASRKEYVKLSLSTVVLFIMSLVCIFLLYEEKDAVLAVFLVVFLDYVFMLLTILEPIKNLSVLSSIKRLKKAQKASHM